MNLLDKLGSAARGLALSTALALPVAYIQPGCLSVREGDTEVSAAVSPFGAGVSEKEYDSSGKVLREKKMDITMAFGNVHQEVKFYGPNGKYLGGYKVMYNGVMGGNPDVRTERYDENHRVVESVNEEREFDIKGD